MLSSALTISKQHLNSLGMTVTQDWLDGCVEFFCQDKTRIDNKELCDMVKNQWILGDLQEISPGCLPANLSSIIKTTLEGIYVLQMSSLLDIGTPAYQQLQKIQKVDTTNIDATETTNVQESPQRILKLVLTDGVQVISGLEFKPMRNLNTNLTPGIKIQIKGPICCRRGVLILEEKHVTILGGEVDDILESNNYRNILKRKIESNNNQNPAHRESFIREPTTNPILNQPQNNIRSLQTVHVANHPRNIIQTNQRIHPTQPNNAHESIDDLDAEMFEDNFDLAEIENMERQALSQISVNSKQTISNYVDIDTIMDHDSQDFDDYYNEPTVLVTQTYPVKVSKLPWVYIKQLEGVSDQNKLNNTYTVKAQIIKIIGKLALQRNNWVLRCRLCDGSGIIDVDYSSDLLSPMIGYTPEEMTAAKKQISSKPEIKQLILNGLENAMNAIQNLDCLFRITYKETGPCITKTESINQLHHNQLKERMSMVEN